MKHRLFIAILLPEEIKEKLIDFQRRFKKFEVRWTKSENLHLTLAFLGYTDQREIERIKEIIKKIAQKFSPFILNLNQITLGPDSKRPRMIWAVGEAKAPLKELVEDLKNQLTREKIFVDRKYPFKVHLTLARAKGKELYGRKIDKKIDLTFSVKEIALMESRLSPKSAEYKILEKYPLK